MDLYKADGSIWNPHGEDTRDLDDLLRRIVDAIRYRQGIPEALDLYGQSVTRLTEAATQYTAALRSAPEAAGNPPELVPDGFDVA